MKRAAGADEVAGPRRQALEGDAVALGLLLDALGFEIVDHDGRKILPGKVRIGGGAFALGGIEQVDQFLLAGGQHAMRRQALDREGTGDADAGIVGVRLVVEIFDIGTRGDAGVDLALPGDPRLPPLGVRFGRARPARRLAVRAGSATLPRSSWSPY